MRWMSGPSLTALAPLPSVLRLGTLVSPIIFWHPSTAEANPANLQRTRAPASSRPLTEPRVPANCRTTCAYTIRIRVQSSSGRE